MMLCLEKRNVTFLNTKIYSMQYEENAYVSVIGIIETGSYLRFAIAIPSCAPIKVRVHPPGACIPRRRRKSLRESAITILRTYLYVFFFFFFFFYLRTPPNAPRPRNLTEYAKLPNWIRL